MKHVWVAAAVAPLAFAATLAHAQTTVSNSSTTPLATSTAGNVTIASGGAITVTTASTPAVTLNSSNTVSNVGALTATATGAGLNGVNGVLVNAGASGLTGEVQNSGSISLSETDTSTVSTAASGTGISDTENGVLGEYAAGSNRYGILVNGTGTFTGIPDATNNLANPTGPTAVYSGGTITVIGENSAGIAIMTSVTGDVVINGTIAITGGNYLTSDVSYGLLTTANINGNINIGGSVTATGGNAIAVAVKDGATGAISLDGTLSSTGYRVTAPRASYAINTIALIESDPALMMQGGPALAVAGVVGGGLNIDAPVVATSTVAASGGGSIISYGDAPGVLVGNASTATTLAPVASDTGGHGFVIGGSVSAQGVYDNVNATGVQIGGAYYVSQSGSTAVVATSAPVTINGGINVTGAIGASTYGNVLTEAGEPGNAITSTAAGYVIGGPQTGNATGLDIGSGATVPKIDVTGSISATALTNQTTAPNLPNVTAIQIDKGATGGIAITNNGAIAASINSTDILNSNNVEVAQGGTAGTATAILDNAGAITSITNTNSITAAFATANTTDVVTGAAVALNLAANTAGVTVTQNQGFISSTSATGVVTTTATSPAITGNVIFGSGAAHLILTAGTLTGDTSYGSSTANSLSLSDGAQAVTAPIMMGGLTVASGGQLAVSVTGGTLDVTKDSGQIITPTLTVGAGGQVILAADPSGTEPLLNGQFNVSGGTLSVASGAKIGLNLQSAIPGSYLSNPDHFVLILANPAQAAQLSNFTLGQTPYLYHITLDTTYQADALTLDVTRATAQQLNLNGNQAAAYNAFYNAFITDPGVEADLLSKTTEATFKKFYDQFLPDFAGGPFESLAIGQRAIIREQEAEPLKLETDQTRGWVQEIGFLSHQGDNDSAGYDAGGFGVSAGVEKASGNGVVGVSGSFLSTEVADAGQDSYGHMAGSLLEAGVYWRSNTNGVNANASLDGGYTFLSSQRQILDTAPNPAATTNPNLPTTTATLQRVASANWGGGLISGQVGLNAPIDFNHFYIRPEVSADYIALMEEGYSEHGGGSAFDLTVAPRTSQQASAQVDMVFGATFGDAIKYRPELLIGWRGVVYGGPGNTTAHFTSGSTDFTLTPNFQDKGGLLARLGLRAGGPFADFTADAGGEWHGDYESYDARALARFLF